MFQWNFGSRSIPLGERTLVMGVLNVTPDSFSDGGLYFSPQAAIDHGLALLDEGADILDIGGESTRPGTPTATPESYAALSLPPVSPETELARVLPVIEAIKRLRPSAILSIDTYKAAVARRAVLAGAEIVNDVSGFLWDADMSRTIRELSCGAILMHTRGLPHQWRGLPPAPDIVALVHQELYARIASALAGGIHRASLVIDPGFGFGKNRDENFSLLAHFAQFQTLGFPLLAALSRKGFLASAPAAERSGAPYLPPLADAGAANSGLPPAPSSRDTATLAATVAAALSGAHIVRVHAVRPIVAALAIADAILRAK